MHKINEVFLQTLSVKTSFKNLCNLPDTHRNTIAAIFKMIRGSKIPSLKSLALSSGIVAPCEQLNERMSGIKSPCNL